VESTKSAPLMTPSKAAGSPPGTTGSGLDLGSLSVRELICELAVTETLLRQCPCEMERGSTTRLQARIVGELRGRRPRPGRDQDAHTHFSAIADGGPLDRE
jgi:hypothetical protein